MNIFVTLVLIASTDGIKVIYLQLLGFIKKMKVKWQAEVTTLGLLMHVITDQQQKCLNFVILNEVILALS